MNNREQTAFDRGAIDAYYGYQKIGIGPRTHVDYVNQSSDMTPGEIKAYWDGGRDLTYGEKDYGDDP